MPVNKEDVYVSFENLAPAMTHVVTRDEKGKIIKRQKHFYGANGAMMAIETDENFVHVIMESKTNHGAKSMRFDPEGAARLSQVLAYYALACGYSDDRSDPQPPGDNRPVEPFPRAK